MNKRSLSRRAFIRGASAGTAAAVNPQFATLPKQTRIRNENAAYLAARLEEIPGIAAQKLHKLAKL